MPPGHLPGGIAANKHGTPVDGSCFCGPRSTDPFRRVPGGWAEVEIDLRPDGDDIVRRLRLNVAAKRRKSMSARRDRRNSRGLILVWVGNLPSITIVVEPFGEGRAARLCNLRSPAGCCDHNWHDGLQPTAIHAATTIPITINEMCAILTTASSPTTSPSSLLNSPGRQCRRLNRASSAIASRDILRQHVT